MVSSKDVAKIAKVSQATVSRVMNNPQSVKLEKRKRVLDAMEKLNYKPNLIARSLITNSTKTIALISGQLNNGFFVETTDAIINVATKYGYNTMVFFEGELETSETLNTIISSKVDGILMSNISLDDPLLEVIENSGIPYVFYNRHPRKGGNYVVLDNAMAGEMITNYLVELGHKKIAYISGPESYSTFYNRKKGYESVMKGVHIGSELLKIIDPTPSEVEKTTFLLMSQKSKPTAIIFATDAMALIGMDTIMSMGYKIPEDVSIAGIDDIKISSHQAIMLTSVAHHKFLIGEIAAENLIDMIQNGQDFSELRQVILKPELVIRNTTKSIL